MKSLRRGAVGIALMLLTLGASGLPARALATYPAYLTLTPSSSTARIYAKTKLTGKLKNKAGHVLANRKIRLDSRPATGTVWSVDSTKTTNSSGKVYWSIQATESVYYRLRYAGSTKYRSAKSVDKKITGHHYALDFHEEFSASKVDTSTWQPRLLWGETAAYFLQRYTQSALEATSGSLVITATRPEASAGTTYPYDSGAITSNGQPRGYSFRYGYVETRAQIPKGQGLWSAVWLHSVVTTSWDEIDVLETRGQYPKTNVMSLHYMTTTATGTVVHKQKGEHYPHDDTKAHYDASTAPDLSKGYHTFAVDWSPSHVIWYRDGIERYRVTTASAITSAAAYITANLQLADGSPENKWGGAPTTSTPFPAYLKVDYIRVYKHN
jgi:beta-glucanase (GH16 family)